MVGPSNGARDFEKKWDEIVKKADKDELFRQRLLKNPSKVFQEYDIKMPAGVTVKIVENTPTSRFFVLPESKSSQQASEENLKNVVGGMGPNFLGKTGSFSDFE